jgi:hypothetical protein
MKHTTKNFFFLVSELVQGLLDCGESLGLVGNSLCPQLKSSLLALKEHLALLSVKERRRRRNEMSVTLKSQGLLCDEILTISHFVCLFVCLFWRRGSA